MSPIDVFPKRPLKLPGYHSLPSTFLGWVFTVFALAAAIGSAAVLYSAAVSLADDYRLHASGVIAIHSTVSNYRYRAKTATSEFDVSFVTQEGTPIIQHVDLFPSSFQPDRGSPFVVRYDPASPQHFSTSWGAQTRVSRTINLILFVALYLFLLAGGLFVVLPQTLREKRSLASIRASCTPIAATLVETSLRTRGGGVYISFMCPDVQGDSSNAKFTGKKRFERSEEPFWLDAAKSKMLALQGPDGYTVVLDAALAWVELTDSERAQIVEAQRSLVEASREPRREVSSAPKPTTLPKPLPKPAPEPIQNSPLRSAAIELSVALNEIVSGLSANTSDRAAQAKDLASRLRPYVEEFDKAVFVTRSRDEASETLTMLIRSRAAENASPQSDPRNESAVTVDYGVGNAVGRYRRLTTIFREMKYHDETL